jgi:Tol biopolymer transport system component
MITCRAFVLFGLVSAILLTSRGAAQATEPPQNDGKGTIYAYSWEGGDGGKELVQGIYALDPERLTWTRAAEQSDQSVWDTYFRVSPDGRFLAFARYDPKGSRPEVVGVSIRDLKDQSIRNLPTVAGNAFWSSDGKRLMVPVPKGEEAGTKLSRMEAWIINADATEPKKLPIPESEQVDDWSPDGSWILTGSRRDKGVSYQLYRMRLDGTDARRLTTTGKGVLNLDGRISPDGRSIAYFRVGDRQSGIWMMDADGANARRVYEYTEAIPERPSWSPDSRKLAFCVHAERRHEKGYLVSFNHMLMIVSLNGDAPVKVAPPLPSGLENAQWTRTWK